VSCSPRIVVLTGPASSGKTTTIEFLSEKFGYSYRPEVARIEITYLQEQEKKISETSPTSESIMDASIMLEDPELLSIHLYNKKLLQENSDQNACADNVDAGIILMDRALPDSLAYAQFDLPEHLKDIFLFEDNEHLRLQLLNRYQLVVVFEALPFIEDGVRRLEENEFRTEFTEELFETYRQLGYDVEFIPATVNDVELSKEERAELVIEAIKKHGLL
jgi:nicotinamide riboside kinase